MRRSWYIRSCRQTRPVLFSTNSVVTLLSLSLVLGACHVIRTVALGVVCLAGLGAIAAAAKKLPTPQPIQIDYPKVAGSKADRLPLIAHLDTPIDAEKVDVVYVPPIENVGPSKQSAPPKAASPPLSRIASRHWHQPHDRKFFDTTKQGVSTSKFPTKVSADRTAKRVADAKECRSDGLDPLLRKLNLSPNCE